MENETISEKMNSTIPNQNSEKDAVKELRRAIKQLPPDEYLEEMAKIWITLDPFQKVDLIQQATRASHLNQAIAHLAGTKMGRLKVKQASESVESN